MRRLQKRELRSSCRSSIREKIGLESGEVEPCETEISCSSGPAQQRASWASPAPVQPCGLVWPHGKRGCMSHSDSLIWCCRCFLLFLWIPDVRFRRTSCEDGVDVENWTSRATADACKITDAVDPKKYKRCSFESGRSYFVSSLAYLRLKNLVRV